jgi:hypothetical protein
MAPAVIALCVGVLVAFPPHSRQATAQDAQIQAHLAAGEFAPALALARRLPARADRDAWLGRIAAAQARAGAQNSAIRTAGEISDDQVRTNTLSDLAAVPVGGQGGAAMADFQSLIDLIISTVQPTTWEDVGGPGSIAPFPTGVYVDSKGLLQPLLHQEASGELASLRALSLTRRRSEDARRQSPLRKISLPRLEREVQLLWAMGKEPTEVMRVLAGLTRIKYVFVYPDSGDLVLAGPAGDWTRDDENRIVSVDSGQPVVQLDDLVVVLRHMVSRHDAQFGCMINPTQEGLARMRAFLDESSKRSLPPGLRPRERWLAELRSQLGKQDIEVFGLDPRTRAARVMVEADYRMKLVGMGLEEGVPGVESYLDSVVVPRGQAPPPMGVLRWWFTLNYDAVLATEDHTGFALRGQGVKVLSENERLAADGRRIHTGQSEVLTLKFAHSFTAHFDAICQKYPVYAELRNLFDLALVSSLVRQQRLAERVGWHMTHFGDPGAFQVQLGPAPEKVETVINHRVVNQIHILTGVSGGVMVQPASLVAPGALETDTRGQLTYQRTNASPGDLSREPWWWD